MSHRVIRSGAIAAALTLTTVLAGCSAGGGGGDTPTGSGPIDPTACDGVTLSFIGLDGEQGDQELADWRKEHDMTLQTTSTTDMSQLIAAIKSGQQFDLATMTKDDAQRMIEGGIFQALPTDRLENWADMVPGMAENSNIRDTAGTVFGAPIAWGDGPFVYRPDKADIVDDRLSILDLTKPEYAGLVGWAPANASFQSNVTAMRLLLGEETAAQWLADMVANGAVNYGSSNTNLNTAVASGEVVFGITNHYYMHNLLKDTPDLNLVQVVFPEGDAGSLVNVAGAGVLATSDQKGLAQRLILYLLGNEAQTYFTQETSEYPLVAGVEPNADLIPLDMIVQPEIDLSDLDDLQTTLEMIEASGALD